MPTDLFKDSKLKIKRADQHITALREIIATYTHKIPYKINTDVNLGNGRYGIELTLIKDPPNEISIISSEIVHHLRSSLDVLSCSLAKTNGATNISSTYFPFAGSRDGFESNSTQKKIKLLSPDHIKIIHSFKPYKGGNDLLWSLNQLSNTDKHRMIVPIGGMSPSVNMNLVAKPLGTIPHKFSIPKAMSPLEKSTVIFIYPEGLQFEGDITVLFDITFRNTDPIECQPVITVLNELSSLVKRIVEAFETSI